MVNFSTSSFMTQTNDSQIFRNIFLILNVAPAKSVLIMICLDQWVTRKCGHGCD